MNDQASYLDAITTIICFLFVFCRSIVATDLSSLMKEKEHCPWIVQALVSQFNALEESNRMM